VAALLRRHPDYDYNVKRLDDKGCTIEILRFDKIVGEATFDEGDAKRAGLLQKTGYQKYPDDLYFAKAITRAQRRYAPDVFMAPVYASEEMGEWDVIDALPPLPESSTKQKPPEFSQLIEQFGLDACTEAGVFNTQTEQELWTAIDKLTVQAASEEYENES
jgi:hypothetical protein